MIYKPSQDETVIQFLKVLEVFPLFLFLRND